MIKNKSDYYRLLQEVRIKNNWEEWVLYVLKGNKHGVGFTSFLPAISKKSAKSIRIKVREVNQLQVTNNILKDIAKELNPKIRGWISSYAKFYSSELKKHLQYINIRLACWAKRKFKRLRES
ncbi:hypothetical protein GO495_05790 [Chitinophaga oryziterrae]|uniref:Group II intron maturase-specific domain-containing protein n=1 Tax=Chitinophaga oryziterrae TaxID=1031224 RepID=A0A6N8J734_9BACT|nr:hypothetical protein [Chitinophaga oryziterrae]